MDYVVGSVAALISGNVTPNRPKIVKRALTPMKHQQSPNVTPKSELVGDRSIFLSPTLQKKKAIVKKSPKRIFQNPDLDSVDDEGNTSLLSPKADKVKKHLKDELESSIDHLSPKSLKNKSPSPKKRLNVESIEVSQDVRTDNENTPKKKKKKLSLNSDFRVDSSESDIVKGEHTEDINMEVHAFLQKTPKKKKKLNQFTVEPVNTETDVDQVLNPEKVNKKAKKGKKNKVPNVSIDNLEVDNINSSVNKENEGIIKKKKNKKRNKNPKNTNVESNNPNTDETSDTESNLKKYDTNESNYINPNAITNKDTDSEHESDDEIESENEESNKAVLDTGPESSSDEEEPSTKKTQKVDDQKEEYVVIEQGEVKRTLFVGNVPFSSKCKKEIKSIFSKYGDIETVRIRTVPVKDARVTPKLAVIKEELHPDRSTVNVYIKYKDPSSVDQALVENNTVLNNCHLRVSRSDVTGSEHDPRYSVFVGNMPFALEDDGLRALFEKCGQIESVRIIRDRKTNAGKGFGYVNFTSKDGVELALALTEEDLTLKNRILRVKRCTQPTMNKQRREQNQTKFNPRQLNQRQQHYQPRQHNNQRGFNDRFQVNRNKFGNDRFQTRGQNEDGNRFQRRGQSEDSNRFQRRGQSEDGNRFQRRGQSEDGNRFQRRGQNDDGKGEGAYRRIMNKRKPQDGNEGPPNKRQKALNQPREKKTRPEFVGMTAEKKKFQKRRLNKDQKKKKAFSEILTK